MEDTGAAIGLTLNVALTPAETFDTFVQELAIALAQGGMDFEAGADGHVTEGEREVGSVVEWRPGCVSTRTMRSYSLPTMLVSRGRGWCAVS